MSYRGSGKYSGPSAQALVSIIRDGDAKALVEEAEGLGSALGDRTSGFTLTTNQIRAIFGTVRQVQMSWDGNTQADRQLVLLKPKLKYRAARDRSKGLQLLADVLSESIDLVLAEEDSKRERFSYFVDFFEAILAYHKVAGGV